VHVYFEYVCFIFASSCKRGINVNMLCVDGRLRWTSHGGADTLSHNNLFRVESEHDKLFIQSSGTYFVYLQLTYNGRTKPNVVYVPTTIRSIRSSTCAT